MERLRELLELLRMKGTAQGNFLGLLHVLIGRRITTKDNGTLISAGVSWRELASLFKLLRWEPEVVREMGLDPTKLPASYRQRHWYTVISQAGVDQPAAALQGDRLAKALLALGYVVGPAPGSGSSAK